MDNKKKVNVVIIGAGPAGLTAAYELLNSSDSYNVIILEQSDQIGGISKTINHNLNRIDIGGHRFFSKNNKVTNWWQNFMPLQGVKSFDDKILNRNVTNLKGTADPNFQDNVMLIRKRISRIYYQNNFFDYPIAVNYKTIKMLGVNLTFKAGFSYIKSCIFKRKETNLEDFYINRFGKVLYKIFFKDYTKKVWGIDPVNISADWGKQRIKKLSILNVISDALSRKIKLNNSTNKKQTSLIEEFWYPKFGPGQLWESVAEKIKKLGGKIYFNSNVIKINSINNNVKSVAFINENKETTIETDILISSMPIKDLVNAWNDKNINNEILEICNSLPYRDFITVGLLFKNLSINNTTKIKTLNNIIPDCWIYVQDKNVSLGRVQIFNNWSPYMVKDVENTVWIGLEYFCDENDVLWNKSDDDIIKFAFNELKTIGIVNNQSPLDKCIYKVKKAYPAYFGSYKYFDKVTTFLNKYKNLYCIGRNGQHRYNNMDHSMLTAFEAVYNITKNKEDKTNIWNVNTEQEYHENEN